MDRHRRDDGGDTPAGRTSKRNRRKNKSKSNADSQMGSKNQFTPHWLLWYGLSLVGFGTARQNVCERTNVERFRAHFGIGPLTILAILIDLRIYYVAEDIKDVSEKN